MQSTLMKSRSPPGILCQHGIVVGLSGRVVANAIVTVVPAARVGSISGVHRVKGGSRNRQVGLQRLLGDATDDMQTKLQPPGMHPVGERLESLLAGRGGEAGRGGDQQSLGIQDILPALQLVPERVAHVPPLIDHRIRPAVDAQFGQFPHIGFECGLVQGEAVGIPAIPTHGRCWSDFVRQRGSCGEQ